MRMRHVLALCAVVMLAALPARSSADIEDFIRSAEAGDVSAQKEVGFAYVRGTVVLQDYAKAADWFRMAADAGDAEAQNQLARMYASGLGLGKDPSAAAHWFGQAAQQGEPAFVYDYAAFLEAEGQPGTDEKVAALYGQAAAAGHAPSAISLGVLFQTGRGVPEDFARAKELYEVGIEAGLPRAFNNLGLLYARGHGVQQDYPRAAELFATAADAGLTEAMRNLGVLYENGFGVDLDVERAAALYRMSGMERTKPIAEAAFVYDPRLSSVPQDPDALDALQASAEAGDPVAMFQVGWLLAAQPSAPFENLAQARLYFERAARSGHGPSMVNLSLMYFQGRGAPQDYVLGHKWLLMSKRAGTRAPALDKLSESKMTAEQINTAQALALEQVRSTVDANMTLND